MQQIPGDPIGVRRVPSGLQVTFSNGWTASVMWGYGNYGSYYGEGLKRSVEEMLADPTPDLPFKTTAECACWFGDDDAEDVRGWQTEDQIAAFLVEVASRTDSSTHNARDCGCDDCSHAH